MKKATEWVKKSVDYCIHNEYALEAEKKVFFEKLESEYLTMTNSDKKNISEIMKSSFILEDLVYVLSFFVSYMEISDFRKLLLDSLLQMDFDCLLGTMLKLQAKAHIPDCYDRHRKLNEKMINKYAEQIQITHPYIPLEERHNNRIVIITEQILSENHAPTKIVLDHIYALKKRKFEVVLYVCPSDMPIQEGIWHNAGRLNSVQNRENGIVQYKDIEFEIHEYVMNQDVIINYKRMFDFIYEYKPIFVYSMGMSNPIAELSIKMCTLVAHEFAVGLPISEAQILIEITKSKEDYVEIISDDQMVFKPKELPLYFDNNIIHYSREELNLPENKFLVAIAGNRLEQDIDSDFVDVMIRIVKDIPDVCFVLVGDDKKIKPLLDVTILKDYIIHYGYCQQLISLYNVMDLYLNPKRLGGGFSGAMAMVANLPVVTLPECDVATNVGDEFTVNNYDEMIETVKRYYYDKDFYKRKEAIAIEKTVNNEEKTMDAIIERVNKIIELVKEREDKNIV